MTAEALEKSIFPSFIAISLQRGQLWLQGSVSVKSAKCPAQYQKTVLHSHTHTGEMSPLALSQHLHPTIFNCEIFP